MTTGAAIAACGLSVQGSGDDGPRPGPTSTTSSSGHPTGPAVGDDDDGGGSSSSSSSSSGTVGDAGSDTGLPPVTTCFDKDPCTASTCALENCLKTGDAHHWDSTVGTVQNLDPNSNGTCLSGNGGFMQDSAGVPGSDTYRFALQISTYDKAPTGQIILELDFNNGKQVYLRNVADSVQLCRTGMALPDTCVGTGIPPTRTHLYFYGVVSKTQPDGIAKLVDQEVSPPTGCHEDATLSLHGPFPAGSIIVKAGCISGTGCTEYKWYNARIDTAPYP
jgi:hypothetical protein